MAKAVKSSKPVIEKQDFIKFLASATPEEINKYIAEKGKPGRLIEPIIFFEDKNKKNEVAISFS